jgi:hypothetical protein
MIMGRNGLTNQLMIIYKHAQSEVNLLMSADTQTTPICIAHGLEKREYLSPLSSTLTHMPGFRVLGSPGAQKS